MFYGWKLLAALCVIYFISTGTVFYGFGVLLPAMIQDMGWTRTEASLGFSILFLVPGLSGPMVAWSIGRIGAGTTIALGGLLAAAGAVSIFYTTSLLQYYFSIGALLGIGVAMQTIIPGTQVLTNWFARRRAFALGIFMAMGGAGAFVVAPAFSYLLEATGDWRIAWLVMAVATLTSSVLAFLVVRDRPEDVGTQIDGLAVTTPASMEGVTEGDGTDLATPSTVSRVYQTQTSWELKDAAATTPFWFIIAAAAFVVVGQTMVSSQGVIHMIDVGIPSVTAGAVLGTVGLLSAGGRLITGFLGDNFDPRYMLAGGLLMELISLGLFNSVSEPGAAYLFAIVFGAGNGLAIVASPALVANYFGNENYAKILGVRGLVITPLAASGPILAASTFENMGSYGPIFIGFAVLALVPVLAILIMRPPQFKRQETRAA